MLEKPNISDEKIISALQGNFSVPVIDLEFIPFDLDLSAWAYRVEIENAAYFLKLRKQIPNPAEILIPRFLRERGIGQVMAPLSTKDGGAWAIADDFFFILYPFIAGERVMDVGMSEAPGANSVQC